LAAGTETDFHSPLQPDAPNELESAWRLTGIEARLANSLQVTELRLASNRNPVPGC
jgi:hypothetical protein